MGLVKSILGDPNPPNHEVEDDEPKITISKEDHEPVHPVAVRSTELLAFAQLLDEEESIPRVDGGMHEFERKTIDDAWKSAMPDNSTWSDEIESTRKDAREIIEAWEQDISGYIGTILLPIGICFRLEMFLTSCEARAEQDNDPFDLSDAFLDSTQLVKRLKSAEKSGPSVIAHVDDIPTEE
jgi:hypothetical protein